jgi:pimeloyl-ACP methyl ester carboxylesterase
VRVVWGTDDLLLAWPSASECFSRAWLPHAEWIVLQGVGHRPQLDAPLETAKPILGCTAG